MTDHMSIVYEESCHLQHTPTKKLAVWVQLTIRIQLLTAWPFPSQDEKENPSKVSARAMFFSRCLCCGMQRVFIWCVLRGSSLMRDNTSMHRQSDNLLVPL